MAQIIITSPSLDPSKNVSGVSSVTQFIIDNNTEHEYLHFELGKKDKERGGIFRIKGILKSLYQWNILLKQHPEAIIHYNFPLEKPSILRDPIFMYVARTHGNPMVIHIHGGAFLTSPTIPMPFKQILKKVFAWQLPFIVLSEPEKETLNRKFGAKDVHSLPNCVDLRNAATFHRAHPKTQAPLTLGYLGRIAETKGMDYLLEACTTLQNWNIPFLLRMAGAEEIKDKYLPLFNSKLGKQFEYVGLVSGQEKNEFLRNIDIFIMPTFFEGLPMSLLESMSYGVVPVVTPVGSIPTIVKDKDNGIYINVKNSESIVDAIIKLHKNRGMLHELSEKAREKIFKQFDTKSYIDNLNNLYKFVQLN